MAKQVRLADIAQRVGVSTVTVSKALAGQKGVSEEMREKIKQLADEMGYVQSSKAKRTGMRKSYNIGLLIEESYLDKYDSFYWQMYQQIATKAMAWGCFTLMEVVGGQKEEAPELPKLIKEQKVDGVIVLGKMPEFFLAMIKKNSSLPIVYMDFTDEGQDVDAVVSDSFYGTYQLTNYLFSMGHEKIAYVGTLLATTSITDRYLGYVKAMMEHGAALRDDWRIDDRDIRSGYIDEVNLLTLPKDMPTAFVCNCDLSAGMLINKLKQNGYRVPEDVSVVGYDNYIYPGICDIGITTYEVDLGEMAKRTVGVLLNKLQDQAGAPSTHIVEGHLVIKDSVRRI
ncbi:MAG: LacI family DNA-binding transcriptional regulator [Lachnospiraceae bacterium]|nr:LacI family DNA-binding transcriptional regulator [Lachnospiraceae bacterium]